MARRRPSPWILVGSAIVGTIGALLLAERLKNLNRPGGDLLFPELNRKEAIGGGALLLLALAGAGSQLAR
jgi:hypothetical protein